MNAGDTFLLTDRDVDEHLWVVISDPTLDSDQVLIVNLTSWKHYHDPACVLEVGDHPFISRRTCVNYAEARIVTLMLLQDWVARGRIRPQAKCDPELLARIRNSAMDSTRMALEKAEILIDQGLVDME